MSARSCRLPSRCRPWPSVLPSEFILQTCDVAQIARESVDQVVLAAVRFIGDHDDVAALG